MHAIITKITRGEFGIVTVELEWSGEGRTINDFDLSAWMEVRSSGGNLRNGWVVGEHLDGLEVGDTVCADEPSEIVSVSDRAFGELPGTVEVGLRDQSSVRVALDHGMTDDRGRINQAGFLEIERELRRRGHKSLVWSC
jgi:hypothetical protein